MVAVLIVGAGIASGLFAAITNNSQKSEYLIGRAQTIANTLSPADLKSLDGNPKDLSTDAYVRSKRQLDQVRNSNLDLDYIRVFTTRNNQVSINIDAQPTGSSYYGDPGTTIPQPSPELQATLAEGKVSHDALLNDYSTRWVAGYAPVQDPKTGEIVAAVGVFTSATDYYLEILLYGLVPILLAIIPFVGILRDLKLQAKEHEIMHLKNQFISIASHELRSPLTGMLWGIHSLQQNEDKLTQAQVDLLKDMYKSTAASLATVNEILDSSIFERGQANKLQKDTMDLLAILSQVTATLTLGAKEKKISLEMFGDWPENAYVIGDVEALKRAFMNVISNAIKYSTVLGTVQISYRLGDNNEHIISVKDDGIGIPADEQERVLDGYYRASNAKQVHSHGAGLGLWITRMIIEQHGGRVWLNSAENRGTTMYLALPTATDPQATSAKSVGSKSRGRASSKSK